MKIRVNANAIVENSKSEILVIKLKNGIFAGGICLPGGGIDPGELGKDAVMREVQEETGIIIHDAHQIGFCELIKKDKDSHRIVILYYARGEGVPKETNEGIGKWASCKEAISQGIPFTKEAIKMWREGKIYFNIVE